MTTIGRALASHCHCHYVADVIDMLLAVLGFWLFRIGDLLSPLGLEVALLTRDAANKERTIKAINVCHYFLVRIPTLASCLVSLQDFSLPSCCGLQDGKQVIVVGTHALLQRYIRFPRYVGPFRVTHLASTLKALLLRLLLSVHLWFSLLLFSINAP